MTQWVEPGPALSARRTPVINLLRQAAAGNPDDIALQRQLAESLTAIGAQDAAIETWRRVVEADPQDGAAWRQLGLLLLDARQGPQALEAFERLCALLPHHSASHILLARALRTVGAEDAAEAAMDRAIALAPNDPACVRTVGRRLLAAGKGAELAAHTRSAAKHAGWSTRLLDHLLAAHALQGNETEVAALLRYDAIVDRQVIDPPSPYASLAEFNAAIAEELRSSVRIRRSGEYSTDKVNTGLSVDGGAVDAAINAGNAAPACAALIALFRQSYAAYCDKAARDGHPLHRQLKPGRAAIVGGGHLTRQTGHIAPHTHSGSWLVGVYYVAVPDTADNDTAGCLEFGPPFHLAEIPDSVWPRHRVRPVPGLLVLFPGYLCHWSVPTRVDEERIVLSFDVTPANA